MSGYCSLQATSVPSCRRARCTWPRLAAAAASWLNCANFDCQSGPSSLAMRRRTKFQPIGGALACNCASSAAYSAGSASGTVERNCATFISGPFSPPRMVRRSSACAARSVLMPNMRAPATRAAMPPTAPEVRAMRRSSPNRLLRSDIEEDGGGETGARRLPLPLREGVRGRGRRASSLDCDQNAFKVAKYIADWRYAATRMSCYCHPASRTASPGASMCDTPSSSTTSSRGRTVEISDVRPQRDLPPELQAADLMLAKSLPELSFRWRWIVGALRGRGRAGRSSVRPPPPNPLPQGEGETVILGLFLPCSLTPSPPARR